MEDYSDSISEDKLGLLEKCSYCEREFRKTERLPHKRMKYWIVSIFAHVSFFALGMLALNYVYSARYSPKHVTQSAPIDHDGHIVGTVSSPLNHHAHHHVEAVGGDYWNFHTFFGEPNYGSDFAWGDLIRPRSFRLHRNEAKRLNFTDSVLVKPGQDFGAELGVIHNLHCLRRIRQSLYPEYYYPDASEDEMKHDRTHNLHCLEAIRSSVLCYPDLNPHPYFWSDDPYHPITVSAKVTRKCANWEALQDVLESRNFKADLLMADTGPPN